MTIPYRVHDSEYENYITSLYFLDDKIITSYRNEILVLLFTVVYPIRNGHFKMANCTSSIR
jgi:hypothetical protein